MAVGLQQLDRNIRNAFEPGTTILDVQPLGMTVWSTSSRITYRDRQGKERSFFLKVNPYVENGEAIARGEYESSKALHHVIRRGCPRPVLMSPLESDPRRFFLLYHYRQLYNELPPVKDVVNMLSRLHRSPSPDGKFGFHVETYRATVPVQSGHWFDTWEECFTNLLSETLQLDRQTHGETPDVVKLHDAVLNTVVPRLLRPLETEGRTVTPVLLHGNLWHGNMATDEDGDEHSAVFFDSSCFYGHSEYDLGCWRSGRYRTNRTFRQEYVRVMGESSPAQDFDERNALYALRVDLLVSCIRPTGNPIRSE